MIQLKAAKTFEEFSTAATALGFDAALVREWDASHKTPEHTHPFDANVLVIKGDYLLGCGGETKQLQAGDFFSLEANVPHWEHYGEQGALIWVARKNRSV